MHEGFPKNLRITIRSLNINQTARCRLSICAGLERNKIKVLRPPQRCNRVSILKSCKYSRVIYFNLMLCVIKMDLAGTNYKRRFVDFIVQEYILLLVSILL